MKSSLISPEVSRVDSDAPDIVYSVFQNSNFKYYVSEDVSKKLAAASLLEDGNQIKVPTLLIAGDLDKRCPINQSKAFVKAMWESNQQAELIQFPQDGHDLSSSIAIWDSTFNLVRWFEFYLRIDTN